MFKHLSFLLFFIALTINASEFPPIDEYGYENFDLTKFSLNKPVHICVHPSLGREGHEKIFRQVNFLTSNENYTQILLVDARKTDIAGSELWKDLFVTFSTNIKTSYAPGGIMNFKTTEKEIQKEFIFSGQNFNMCILHNIDNVIDTFVSVETPEIILGFKADSVLIQDHGQDDISLPAELGNLVTLKELIEFHPKVAVEMFQKYVDYVCDGAIANAGKYHKNETFNCYFSFLKKILPAKTNNELSDKKTTRKINMVIK